MRFGLCCIFLQEEIPFRTTTAKALSALPRREQLEKLSTLCTGNAGNLLLALQTVSRLKIGAFRILSGLFPRMTHPEVGYTVDELPQAPEIVDFLGRAKTFAKEHDIRLSFHPDQFIVLSSPTPAVVASAIRELDAQAEVAEAVGADVITLHAGGVYGSKEQALVRFCEVYGDLPERVRTRLALENDDISYTVRDLLPACYKTGIPLVYDVHHHRCNGDGLSIEEATYLSGETWLPSKREQYCHISSPRAGWGGADPKPHADYIDPADFPEEWLGRSMTLDVEAKAKELAVLRLMRDLKL
ncbi:UV DNA damage repair endonuclease UvsE [Geomonas sp. RF6]|uniref:UV DNA damage repair endonuclease UvsE n=1 Tax=Geomonas sp. RF6 TaxID=2897342 RepID=UPI001E5C3234|nr:UV DNA damage repair endonuclease UvsE [Geomonas sp. RF6]UFS72505.1 UV DNA damage repair endonuclease UvsE [Geomonas sp. RF6]